MVQPLRVLQSSYRREAQSNENQKLLRRILENLAGTKLYLTSDTRREISPDEMSKSRNIYEAIAKNNAKRAKELLRIVGVPGLIPEHHNFTKVVETELQSVVHKKSAALLDRPVIEKSGNNDFLVFEASRDDPFVTVIPNNIYYNVEKKCVNWLDDCSLKGIRAKLLQKEHFPFK